MADAGRETDSPPLVAPGGVICDITDVVPPGNTPTRRLSVFFHTVDDLVKYDFLRLHHCCRAVEWRDK